MVASVEDDERDVFFVLGVDIAEELLRAFYRVMGDKINMGFLSFKMRSQARQAGLELL